MLWLSWVGLGGSDLLDNFSGLTIVGDLCELEFGVTLLHWAGGECYPGAFSRLGSVTLRFLVGVGVFELCFDWIGCSWHLA